MPRMRASIWATKTMERFVRLPVPLAAPSQGGIGMPCGMIGTCAGHVHRGPQLFAALTLTSLTSLTGRLRSSRSRRLRTLDPLQPLQVAASVKPETSKTLLKRAKLKIPRMLEAVDRVMVVGSESEKVGQSDISDVKLGPRMLRATTNVEAGEVMLRERPLLTWQRGSALETAQNALATFANLPKRVKEKIRGFYCPADLPPGVKLLEDAFEKQELKLLSIFEVCCSGAIPGSVALFHHVACANHSCRPNAAIRTSADNELRFIALRPIAEGEEICISYIRDDLLLKPWNLRRKALRSWGFRCKCPRCAADFDDTRGQMSKASKQKSCRQKDREDRAESDFRERNERMIEGRWWRKLSQLRPEQQAAEDARMRRLALGLGSQKHWQRRAERLRQRKWLQNLVDFYQKLHSELDTGKQLSHWLLSTVARDVSEAHLWRGEVPEAITAAKYWRRFVHDWLGTSMSLEARWGSKPFKVLVCFACCPYVPPLSYWLVKILGADLGWSGPVRVQFRDADILWDMLEFTLCFNMAQHLAQHLTYIDSTET